MKNYRTHSFLNVVLLIMGMGAVQTALAQEVQVNSADPSTADQGTVNLDVNIAGSGFDNSAKVLFLVTGTQDPGGITVNSTRVRGPKKIIANIDVSESAVVDDFDIEVQMSRGRGGKGTTLFSVKSKGDRIATLDITYEFGALTNDACIAPECVASTITATGPISCGQNGCEFSTRAENARFALPSGLRDLLFDTEWRKTALNPDVCFGSSEAAPVGVAELGTDENGTERNIVFLSRDNDGIYPWYATVGSFARDVDDLEDRQYIFNFEGCGTSDDCGAFDPGSMSGVYEGGELVRIDSHGNDRKFESIPCRCTRSNTPDCPEDVSVPTPQMRITVFELPPAP